MRRAAPHGAHDYYERLQSFRGFGVLMIAFYHCQGVLGGELPMHPVPAHGLGRAQVLAHYLSLALLNGHAALMSFFVLSGFVLTLSLRRGPQRPLAASLAFISARICRIIPANAVAVLVAVAIAAVAGAAPQASVPPPWDGWRVVANMALVDSSINPVAWSLTVELLAMPLVIGMYLITRRVGPGPLILVSAATLLLSFAPRWIGSAPLGRNLFAFFIGMVVAECGPRLVEALPRRRAALWFATAVVLWFASRALLGRWSHWASVVEAFAAASMIALLVAGPRSGAYRVFELRPILWLGTISYSLYLYHSTLLGWFAPPASASMFVRLGGWGPLAAVYAAWMVTVAVAIPVGWLSYELVERAGIDAGRVLTGRLRESGQGLALRRAPST